MLTRIILVLFALFFAALKIGAVIRKRRHSDLR